MNSSWYFPEAKKTVAGELPAPFVNEREETATVGEKKVAVNITELV